MNEDIEKMDMRSLLDEEERLFKILNNKDVTIDHPLIPRLREVKSELDVRSVVGSINTDMNILVRLLKAI